MFERSEAKSYASRTKFEDRLVVCTLRPKQKKKKKKDFNSRENTVVHERKCNYGILQGSAENNIDTVVEM